jgi:hypothetical protein
VRDLLATGVSVELRAADLERLRLAAEGYPRATGATVDGDAVVVSLADDDSASLNRYLAGQGVYLSHLAPRRLSLEEAFMDLTKDDDLTARPAGVA